MGEGSFLGPGNGMEHGMVLDLGSLAYLEWTTTRSNEKHSVWYALGKEVLKLEHIWTLSRLISRLSI